ncbi:MAG TPA: hypothetical protein VHD32_15840 [Candidatus Didemnitutus sp.]|nr:hypothetical protein [Candidatus Didemnitutus sp.]
MKRIAVALVFVLSAVVAQARLGDTLDQIRTRMKSKPAEEPQKNVAVWYFEVQDGQVAYIVTFDAKGHSISEKLEPLRTALFVNATAESFIRMQCEIVSQSKTLHVIPPGEKYQFGGRGFVVDSQQYVLLDSPNQFLLVWTRSGVPSVMALRPEAM